LALNTCRKAWPVGRCRRENLVLLPALPAIEIHCLVVGQAGEIVLKPSLPKSKIDVLSGSHLSRLLILFYPHFRESFPDVFLSAVVVTGGLPA